MFKNKKGFTLIELLVVIAIIGILASIVLASLNSARKKSRDARRIADIKEIQLALELYFDGSRDYPAALSSLASTYIPLVPADPLGSAYTYERCSSTMYHLGAALEDNTSIALNSDLNGPPSGCTGSWGVDTAVCSGTAGSGQGAYCYDISP
jgi:type IV pilus assembly protein PilA